jgi:YrbI family 3-deoxy-D-manno-octulosonate 8-phosphate phosphatase
LDGVVNGMEVLAIIPARGGSKSIPRKNIRDLAGHPLVAYSIAAAISAQTVTRTIVTTDDPEIAEISRQYGAQTPFLRPVEFAQDHSTDFPVFQHALEWLKTNEAYEPDLIVQLRPTSPVRPPGCVDQAVQLLLEHPEADSVRGVVASGQNPYKMWRIDELGRMIPLLTLPHLPEPYNSPRQVLPPTYWQTGHIDVFRISTVLQKHSLTGEIIFPLILDAKYTIDIDTLRDWQRAEQLLTAGEMAYVAPTTDGKTRFHRTLPEHIALLVLDFDGVLTDNRVWVDQEGREMIAANRSDSLRLNYLRRAGVDVMVLSTEINPVVAARCQKMGIPYIQGRWDKADALHEIAAERQIDLADVVYVGNDVNDLPCFPLVGCAVAVADAYPEVTAQADLVLTRRGGYGAVREICDLILHKIN